MTMNSTDKNIRLSSALPRWLSDWALQLIQSENADPLNIYDIDLWHHRQILAHLLNDTQVAIDFAKLSERVPEKNRLGTIRAWIQDVISVYNISRQRLSVTPSVVGAHLKLTSCVH